MNKNKIDPDEIALFYRLMADVKPLTHNKIPLERLSNSKGDRDLGKVSIPFSETELDIVTSEGFLSFKQNCISYKILRKLRKGQYNVDAILDLHGMTVKQAEPAVWHFLEEARLNQVRVGLIIHGKGHRCMPVLKNKLNQWLRSVHFILAFCSATSMHGSRGAIYVLLKLLHNEYGKYD